MNACAVQMVIGSLVGTVLFFVGVAAKVLFDESQIVSRHLSDFVDAHQSSLQHIVSVTSNVTSASSNGTSAAATAAVQQTMASPVKVCRAVTTTFPFLSSFVRNRLPFV
jgi:hypothetical protein